MNRLAGVGLLLLALPACATQPDLETATPVIPPAAPASPEGGPGTYVGEVLNAIETPVEVSIVVSASPETPPTADAAAVATFLRRAAAELALPAATPRFITVSIDNTGQVDAVPLPANVDVLDARGRGANFRPAYEVVREAQEQLVPDTALSQSGKALAQRLLVRENQVRPGQVASVPYVTRDPLADVGQVILRGTPARKSAG